MNSIEGSAVPGLRADRTDATTLTNPCPIAADVFQFVDADAGACIGFGVAAYIVE